MSSLPDTRLVQILLAEEIERIVADATRNSEVVYISRFSDRLRSAFPNSGMSSDEIADKLAMAAVSAGLAVELNRRSSVN
jgi:hypothetical protein